MPRATVTSKGQITIPKVVRDRLHLAAGDAVDFVFEESNRVVLRPLAGSVRDLAGILHRPGDRAVGVREMDEATIADLAADDERIRARR